MGAMVSQITIVYSTVYSGADQRKQQSSAPLAFVRGIHRSTVNSPHKGPVTRRMFSFEHVIMICTTSQCTVNYLIRGKEAQSFQWTLGSFNSTRFTKIRNCCVLNNKTTSHVCSILRRLWTNFVKQISFQQLFRSYTWIAMYLYMND